MYSWWKNVNMEEKSAILDIERVQNYWKFAVVFKSKEM